MRVVLFLLLSIAVSTAGAQTLADKATCKKVVVDFLKYYLKNSEKLDKLTPLKDLQPANENAQHYAIDWKKAEKYFAFIRTNVPWLGETFIKNEIAYFKVSDKLFKENPADEMPIGFDYDRFINGQEDASYIVPDLVKHIASWKVSIKGQTAEVYDEYTDTDEEGRARVVRDKFELVKENGKWKISKCLGWQDYSKELSGATLTNSTQP